MEDKKRKDNAPKDKTDAEVILELTYEYFTVRLWLELVEFESFKEKAALPSMKIAIQDKLVANFHSKTPTMKEIASILLEGPGVSAVEVKFSSTNCGVVLYKNWPE